MDVLIKRSTTNAWPVEASYGESTLVFSGSLDVLRVKRERRASMIKKISQALLAALGILGVAALLYQLVIAATTFEFSMLIERNLFMALFWLSLVGDMYLWAMRYENHHGQLPVGAVNLENANFDVYQMFTKEAKEAWATSVDIES
ncbi:MAG: hypothetical protein M3Q64_01750, partial [bacterium]|nr:hypothetical protein [bacterium]